MKKSLPWIIVGMIVFVSVYAFVFPESQLPVRVSVDEVWHSDKPIGQMLFRSDNFAISEGNIWSRTDGEWIDIGLPPVPFRVELPAGLHWTEPVISMAHSSDDVLYIMLSSTDYSGTPKQMAIWNGEWIWEEANPDIVKFCKMLNAPELLSAEILELGMTSKLSWNGKIIEINTPEITQRWINQDTHINDYTYKITDDGRINRIKEDIVTAVSSRDELDPFLVQSEIVASDKSLYVLLKSTSETSPEKWIQVLAGDLSHEGFIVSRGGYEPISIGIWNDDTLLMLWNDGMLSGYSMWGQEMFSFELNTSKPLDMAITGDMVVILTNHNLLTVTLATRKAEVDVWPRIVSLDRVVEPDEFTLFIGTDTMPVIEVKGDGIGLAQIMGHENGMLVTFSVDPSGLPAFAKVSGEILVETNSGHEVVPYSFIPSGSVRKFKMFSNMLLDLESGEMFDYEFTDAGEISISGISPEDHEIYFDHLSGELFLVTPKPMTPIDLDVLSTTE